MRFFTFSTAWVLFCFCGISFGGSTVAYYRFEEGTAGQAATGTGTVLDSSGNGLNGTPENGPVYSSNVPVTTIPATGASNKLSMSFNGLSSSENQSVFIPDTAPFQLTQSLTIEAYIYCTGTPYGIYSTGQIFMRGDNRPAQDPYQLYVSGNGTTVNFSIENTATVSATIPLNQWTYVAGELNGTTGLEGIYVNGQLISSQTTTQRPAGTLIASDFPGEAIGSLEELQGNTVNEIFPGYIDEVRLSNIALSPGQFLSAVPEPTSIGLLGVASILLNFRPARWRSATTASV